jgi:hypothetical protein
MNDKDKFGRRNTRHKSTADATMRTRSSASDRRKATAAKDRLSLRKDMFKKRLQLAAESHVFQSGEVSGGQVKDAMSLEGPSSLTPQSPSGDRLLDLLRSVMKMEVNSEEATCRVAFEYFRLGKEYVEYINARENKPPPVHSQSFHRVALPHLALITKALTKSTLTHSALLKRLERARKVWLLANLFGKDILTAKAVANISFLDTIPFTIFGDLATSNTETAFVTEIKKLFA